MKRRSGAGRRGLKQWSQRGADPNESISRPAA
jgi:hypothetical protein